MASELSEIIVIYKHKPHKEFRYLTSSISVAGPNRVFGGFEPMFPNRDWRRCNRGKRLRGVVPDPWSNRLSADLRS